MTASADEMMTTDTYELACIDCAFETTVEGDVYDVFNVIDSHQEEQSETRPEHFVNFERTNA